MTVYVVNPNNNFCFIFIVVVELFMVISLNQYNNIPGRRKKSSL